MTSAPPPSFWLINVNWSWDEWCYDKWMHIKVQSSERAMASSHIKKRQAVKLLQPVVANYYRTSYRTITPVDIICHDPLWLAGRVRLQSGSREWLTCWGRPEHSVMLVSSDVSGWYWWQSGRAAYILWSGSCYLQGRIYFTCHQYIDLYATLHVDWASGIWVHMTVCRRVWPSAG